MKIQNLASRLLVSALVTSLALPLIACGGDDAVGVGITPPAPTGTVAPPPGTITPPIRTLTEGTLLPTTTQNLLLDPGFALTEDGGQIAGAFLAVYEQGQGQLALDVRLDSTSPAGFAGGVVLAKEPKAGAEKSRSIQFLAAFTGGKGPFVAKVWVASVNEAGAPRAFPEDGGGFEATILDPARSSGAGAAVLARDPEKTKVANGRTWVLYQGTLTRDLVGGGMMIMTTGTKGGGFELAAPEIVAVSAVAAGGLTRGRQMQIRDMRASERAAIATYGRIPKQLVPAHARTGAGEGAVVPRPNVGRKTKR